MVRRAISALRDGEATSFGWWAGDALGPFMTAYVVYGWSRADALGYDVKQERLNRAIQAAMSLYKDTVSAEAKAFIVYDCTYKRVACAVGFLVKVPRAAGSTNA